MKKILLLLILTLAAACSAPAPGMLDDGVADGSIHKTSEALTEYNATMVVRFGTTCPVGSTSINLLPEPTMPNMYLTKVGIVGTTKDTGYWQNLTGFAPYTATSLELTSEFTSTVCAKINTPGKHSQVTFYWDGDNCPSGHCAETRSPVITNF